jgi:hypothetical protein
MESQSPQSPRSAPSPQRSKGLTWSERQALAKKQAAEEEERSKAASFKTPTSPIGGAVKKWGTAGVVGAAVGAAASSANDDDEDQVEPSVSVWIILCLQMYLSFHVASTATASTTAPSNGSRA